MTRSHCESAPQLLAIPCPGCDSDHVFAFCEIQGLPVDVGRTGDTPEAAQAATRGDIQLCYCPTCGLVHNARYDHAKIGFEPGYEVALHHSETFRQFIDALAERLIERYDLRGRRVLDIGCGDGFFLRTLAEKGGVHGTGIDPTVPQEGTVPVGAGSVHFIRDFWSERYRDLIGDFITTQSMFEDISAPRQFLRQLRGLIGDRNVPIYLEVFNGFRAFERNETWSIHYEQCNYFQLACLCRLMSDAGFEVTEGGSCYQGDQYLYLEGKPAQSSGAVPPPHVSHEDGVPETIENFARCHAANIATWNKRLSQWRAEGKHVAAWGSGGKGVSFLNTLDAAASVQRVIDINPDRQGRCMPGTGQPIVDPSCLVEAPADVIIIMNPLYEQEIRQQAADLGFHGDVVVA